MKKYTFLRSTFGPFFNFTIFILLFQCASAFAQHDTIPWWKHRPLRIYHPNMREVEANDLNVEEFIESCRNLHAEAIVFSTGGPYAFYNTKIPYHVKSPSMGDRDLLEEVINEAHKYGIRVIARFDFSLARMNLFEERPEWFYLDQNNELTERKTGTDVHFFKTELLEGYQNEEFALPILREIFSDYNVDGIHLNAPGFSGTHFREELIKKFNIPQDPETQKRWREERLAEQMLKYRDIIHDKGTDALFMAEINSPENPGWGTNKGFNHELLAGSYTNLLSTSGEATEQDLYKMRWWVALTADWSHASNTDLSGLPMVNLKVGHKSGKLSLKPVYEYRFQCYQAIAHNAGIKAPTYGLINTMPDERTAAMIAEPFGFMERIENYLTGAERIAPFALVWPGKEESGVNPSDFRDEMLGLYRTLMSEHVLFEIVLAHRLTESIAEKYETIIIPSVSVLNKTQNDLLQEFILNGGHLIILDAFPELPLSEEWPRFVGGNWTHNPINCAYAVKATNPLMKLPSVIMLNHDIREVEPSNDAEIWYTVSPTEGGSFIPEVFPVLEKGDKPLLFNLKRGKGKVTWFGSALGTIIWENDLPDYSEILDKMLYHDSDNAGLISTDAPGTVNLTAYRVNSDIVLHLVNGTGKIPLEEPVSIGPLKVKLRHAAVGKISFLSPGKEMIELKPQHTGSNLVITIDKLEAYGILVIKSI